MSKTSNPKSNNLNLTYSEPKQVGDIAKDLLLLIQIEATKNNQPTLSNG